MRAEGELSEAMRLVSTGVESVIRLAPAEQHTLKLFKEVNQMAENLTSKVLELTPELKRKLT